MPDRVSAPLKYFALTYTVTWTCWAAAAWTTRGTAATPARATVGGILFLLGVFAPGIIALAFTDRAEGRAATIALLRRAVEWRVGARWYAFALGFMPAIKLLSALAHRVVTGEWPRFGQEAWYLMAVAIVVSTWVQAGEEIGWRGYALPRLSSRFGLAAASVILGIIWATWHLPLFFVATADTFGQSFPLYLLQVTALSIAAAWLYWSTKGSLLLVMLLHAAINNTKGIVPSAAANATNPFTLNASLVGWLTVGFLWIAAAFFLVRMRASSLPGDHLLRGR